MTTLPRNLFCLNLAYNIGDRDIVEQLLTDFPVETEQCIPTALRGALEVDYLPTVPFFSSRELLKYLSLLWGRGTVNNKLIDAAMCGLIYLVAYYLDRGADIHSENDQALRSAVYYNYIKTIKLLLDRKADIHALNDSALRWAAAHGQTEVVELLLDRKADLHAEGDYALKWAAAYDHPETVKLLRSYMH
jgi:hypothetical protein